MALVNVIHIVVVLCAIGPSVFSPQYRRVWSSRYKTLKQVNRQTCDVSDSKSGLSPRSPVSESLMLGAEDLFTEFGKAERVVLLILACDFSINCRSVFLR